MTKKDPTKYTVAEIYPLYLQKVERKGRSQAELDQVITWLTGFDAAGIKDQIAKGTSGRISQTISSISESARQDRSQTGSAMRPPHPAP